MKTYSIRKKLSKRLTYAIVLTCFFAVFTSFLFAKYEINQLFDANLVKSSKLILGLVKHEVVEEQDPYFVIDKDLINESKLHSHEYMLHSQAWSGGRLIYNSDENLNLPEPNHEGFSQDDFSGVTWRSFVFHDKNSNIKVVVLEDLTIRKHLIYDILFSVMLPFLLCVFLIVLVIYKTVDYAMNPFSAMANKIEKMSVKNLQQIDKRETSSELLPFVNSFNNLVDRLGESLESERRFSDYAAHELRTPLAAIKAQVQLLQHSKNQEKQEEYLKDLNAGVDRASKMVNKLLTLTRLESEKDRVGQEDISMNCLLTDCIKNWQNEIKSKKINLIVDKNNDFVIKANRTYVEILLNNLLENAVKYCCEKGRVEVQIQGNILKVANDGEGIEEKERRMIFGNFFRARNKRSKDGSGLGLAICKKIVDIYDAKILYSYQDGQNVIEVHF